MSSVKTCARDLKSGFFFFLELCELMSECVDLKVVGVGGFWGQEGKISTSLPPRCEGNISRAENKQRKWEIKEENVN